MHIHHQVPSVNFLVLISVLTLISIKYFFIFMKFLKEERKAIINLGRYADEDRLDARYWSCSVVSWSTQSTINWFFPFLSPKNCLRGLVVTLCWLFNSFLHVTAIKTAGLHGFVCFCGPFLVWLYFSNYFIDKVLYFHCLCNSLYNQKVQGIRYRSIYDSRANWNGEYRNQRM